MSRLWIYQSFAEIEENFSGEDIEIDPNISISSLRLYSQGNHLLPLEVITPSQKESITPHKQVVVIKRGETYNGILQSFNDHTVSLILKTGMVAVVRDYDIIIYRDIKDLYTIISGPPGLLKYQTSALGWECRGDVFLTQDNNLSHLTVYAVINNIQQLAEDQDIKQLILISGKIPVEEQPTLSKQSFTQAQLPMAAMSMRMGEVETPTFQDYMTFPLNLKHLNPGHTYLPLLSFPLTKSQRVYFYNLQKEQSPVQVGYIFDAPQNFPSCRVNVHDASGMFIGTSQLEEKRKDENVRMYLGETSTILTKTYSTTENIPIKGNTLWSDTKVSITSQVKNTGENKETVIARYYVGRSKISQASCKMMLTDDGYLEYTLILQPNEEKNFNCSFILEA